MRGIEPVAATGTIDHAKMQATKMDTDTSAPGTQRKKKETRPEEIAIGIGETAGMLRTRISSSLRIPRRKSLSRMKKHHETGPKGLNEIHG